MTVRRTVLVVVATAALIVFSVLVGQAKTISDPDETSIAHHDVESTTLVKPSAGHLAWKTVTWDTWASDTLVGPSAGALTLYLDTRGGPAADYVVRIQWVSVSSALSCQLEKPGGALVDAGDVSRPSQSAVRCVFPTNAITKDKTTRWRVESAPSFALNDDKAPNTGWVRGVG